jgi:hypothetical protein
MGGSDCCFKGCDFVCSVAIESCKFDDVAVAVRWLLRHMPLVSPAARDIEFRMVHPYAASSEDTFLQWNIGKRRAAEVSHIMVQILISCPNMWHVYFMVVS